MNNTKITTDAAIITESAARAAGRRQAIVDVARIEARSKAALATNNAAREHELELLRLQNTGARSRLRLAFAAVVGFVLLAGPGVALAVNGHTTALENQRHQLELDRAALAPSRNDVSENPAPTPARKPSTSLLKTGDNTSANEPLARPAPPTHSRRPAQANSKRPEPTATKKFKCKKYDPICHNGEIITE